MKSTLSVFLICAVAVGLAANALAQTNLQFTSATATEESAVRLAWASKSNEVYQIQEANALETNADGSTAWNILYTPYPSQGTNTFWLDTGNYFDVPPILHPKYVAARFYRILDLGPDTTADEPTVTVTAPTNGSVVSGNLTITVTTDTDLPSLSSLLYVDGQEMPSAVAFTNYVENGTNYLTSTYVINTCEWFNGSHTLFATASSASTLEGPPNVGPTYTGHAVSPFVQVTFNNLVMEISFSQPFFDPTLGQTQLVSADFASNSDWTLTIIDASSNTVRTASGSGMAMAFNWDGTGNGGTNLPAGVYRYLISAQTNGLGSGGSGGSGGGGTNGPPPAERMAPASSLSVDSDSNVWETVPLPPAPPGMFYGTNTDGNEITNMLVPWYDGTDASASPSASSGGGTFSPDGIPGGGDPRAIPDEQSAAAAPVRPPTAPVRGTVGTFGVAYQSYTGNGASGYSFNGPADSCGYGAFVQLDGKGADTKIMWDPLPDSASQANGFADTMKQYGWNSGLNLAEDQLTVQSLSGNGSPFNQVDLGLLLLHGAYGTSMDCTTQPACMQMYFPITSGTSGQYLRMSQMNLGEVAGNNGLKWMAIWACQSLYHVNWQSMQSQHVYPYNGNLHMLLGSDTVCADGPGLLAFWAQYMAYGNSTNYSPMTIQNAWYQAAKYVYANTGQSYPTIVLAVAGDEACIDDMLQTQTNSIPSGTWTYSTQQVYPPQ
jgi:hypothetical protein